MSKISFKINGKSYEVDGKYGPDVSLNEFIRTVADLRGTKVMCQEGGCGACVVAVRAPMPPSHEIKLFSVNSCLVSVLSCHGWEVITVEGIGNRTKGYHDIQSRLAQFNGTQCGYCTPGWIMNMYSLYESKNKHLSMEEVENSFASQMCRCTGYRSIADAFKSFATDVDSRLKNKLLDLEDLGFVKPCGVKCGNKCQHKCDKKSTEHNKEDAWCVIDDAQKIVIDCGSSKFHKVYNLNDVFEAMRQGDYRLIAGNTGQGVFHINEYPANVIDIFNVEEIKGHVMDVNLIIGAGMPLNEMMELFLKLSNENEDFKYLKKFYDHMDLVAHIPVRNIGTIGGNLFMKHTNNDFQSDVFLLFETVGGMVTIADSPTSKQMVSLPDFLKTDMKNKLLLNVALPPLSRKYVIQTYKIMPRSQNAHAVVNAGFMFHFNENSDTLEKATIVYGSISPKFIHATKAEAALAGKDPFTEENLQLALKNLAEDIVPEEAPPEPAANYRKMLALALYYKAILMLCPKEKLNPRYRSGGLAIKRFKSQGTQVFDTDESVWPLNKPIPKIEALQQCSGEATFANDLTKQPDEVFAAFVCANVRPGSVINGFDASEALKIPGVVAFFSAKDIPGKNSFAPSKALNIEEEEILCSQKVRFYGQPAGVIVAEREKISNKAAKLVKIQYSSESYDKPLLTCNDVLKSNQRSKRIKNDATEQPTDNGSDVKTVVSGAITLEPQYHYTMEPQTCVVKPTEDGMDVYASTQWLDLTNIAISECLNVSGSKINVIVRRVGGGYGSKISRATQVACASALVSHLTGRTCRFVLSIEDNMRIIGKRHPTQCTFQIGVNVEGEIQFLKNEFYQNNGCSINESPAGATLHHFKNCYNTKRWYIEANSLTADVPSNTWCRAPSSTEAIAMVEYMMEKIAFEVRKDALDVRMKNYKTEDNPIPELINQLKRDANWDERVTAIKQFNDDNRWRKRAIKMLPMTYGLNYFGTHCALVSIFHGDGSVVLTHGGIEMGQGLNTKAAQVCAYALGVPLDKISVKPSTTITAPNSTVTGGSIGSECISYCTLKACETLMERLRPVKEKMSNPAWDQLIEQAYLEGVHLQASYQLFAGKDALKPYDIYAVVALEVEVDILTGNHDVRRVDLLEDIGRSLSPQIDIGQIEGAFVMGLGYWTSERLVFDPDTGRMLTDRTWTYKPPQIKDIPEDFRVYFRRNSGNPNGVLQSKATGEPAFCLAVVITHAIREAVRAARLEAGYPDQWVDIPNPFTVENIFMAVEHKPEHFKLS